MVHNSLDENRTISSARSDQTTQDDRNGDSAHRSTASHAVRENYREASQIAGPLSDLTEGPTRVEFRSVLTRRQRLNLAATIVISIVADATFFAVLLLPRHFPSNDLPFDRFDLLVDSVGYVLIAMIETLRLIQNATLWIFVAKMRDPVPLRPQRDLRIAVLTTIVPSKEPIEMVAETLRAMRNIEYDGPIDVWILDEEDDPAMRDVAAAFGVHHFSRKRYPEYRQPSGPYAIGRKSGNHNAWRALHEQQYDLVSQMDPDHVPLPEFLTRTVGYFRDPDVAFVVSPQVYGNLNESFVTNGAADQAYIFYGAVQRGLNGLEAPLLIGTNHVYRTAAWDQIGGYQDSVIEDHLTGLRVLHAFNSATGKRWKGIYTPDVLSIGEGPRSWTDYFNQQYRWSYGIWDTILHHSLPFLRTMPLRRALSYICLELFYPSIGIMWLLGSVITALYLILGISSIDIAALPWLVIWLPTVVFQYALFAGMRRINLARHERVGTGLNGILVSLACCPIYCLAGISAVLRRPYRYAITAKSSLASVDSWDTFRWNFVWGYFAAFMLLTSIVFHHDHWTQRVWALSIFATAGIPLVRFGVLDRRDKLPKRLHIARPLPRISPQPDQLLTARTVALDDTEGAEGG